jgi:hypothetical protein
MKLTRRNLLQSLTTLPLAGFLTRVGLAQTPEPVEPSLKFKPGDQAFWAINLRSSVFFCLSQDPTWDGTLPFKNPVFLTTITRRYVGQVEDVHVFKHFEYLGCGFSHIPYTSTCTNFAQYWTEDEVRAMVKELRAPQTEHRDVVVARGRLLRGWGIP